MAIEFVIKDAYGVVELDLTKRIGIIEGTHTYPINSGKQGVVIKKLGPSTGGSKYWAYAEMPNIKGRRYSHYPMKPMMYPIVSVLVMTKDEMNASSSTIYKNIAAQMDANFYYLIIIDERESNTSYDGPINIHYGSY